VPSGATSEQGFYFTAGILLVILVVSVTQLLPSRFLPGWARSASGSVSVVWPQGWEFFVAEPTISVTVVFRTNSGDRLVVANELQMSPGTDWGLGRSELAQLVEIRKVSSQLPAGDWLSCVRSTPAECEKAALGRQPAHGVNDTSSPTLCGHLLITVESPVRWTGDTRLWQQSWKIVKIVNSEITCAA